MPPDALHQYFAGERSAGMLLVGLGVAALTLPSGDRGISGGR